MKACKRETTLNPRVGKRLLAYAAMAGVAGCTSRAAGEVVFTPVNACVDYNYHFDLNHDGIHDFFIASSELSGFGYVEIFPLVNGNRIAATHKPCGGEFGAAAALPAGADWAAVRFSWGRKLYGGFFQRTVRRSVAQRKSSLSRSDVGDRWSNPFRLGAAECRSVL
jgi:hypothetical protein